MLVNRLIAASLRVVAGIVTLAGVVTLSACGGGNGAPNNPFAPGPSTPPTLVVQPSTATIYAHTPATLTVVGGVPPYFAFSSNSAVVPVAQAVAGNTVLLVAGDVAADTPVTITIQDSIGGTATAALTVKAAPLLPNLVTITPNNDCPGSPQNLGGALCSGGTGTATVRVTGPGGGALPNRQVRFEVVQGNFAIQSSNPATPLVSTLTVVSDANGNATVGIAIPVNAVTQLGVIRATDLTSNNQVTGQFTITQVTDGSQVLSVIPNGNTTITGPQQNICSSGVDVAYYIFGGTPPYTIQIPFVGAVALVGSPVLTNGGHFDVITNGSCFENMQFAITDATGRTIPGGNSPTLTNQPGTTTPPPPPTPPPLSIAPASVSTVNCTGKSFPFLVVGGTPPYSAIVSPSPPAIVTATPGQPNGYTVTNASNPTGTTPAVTTLSIVDSSSPQQSATATITCN